nr:unnamed protein product [Naegleria fowleri]
MNKEFTKAADILKQTESEKQQEPSQKETASNLQEKSSGTVGDSELHYKEDIQSGNKSYTSNVDKEMKQAKDIDSNIGSNSPAPQWRL